MSKPFSDGPADYRPGSEKASPYSKQMAHWDDRLAKADRHTNTWRAISFFLVFLATGLGGGLVYFANQTKIEAYVVRVDTNTGEPLSHAELTQAIRPTDAMVAGSLARWIQMTCAKSTDPIVTRQNWNDAYSFVAQKAKAQVDAYAAALKPFENIGTKARTVEVRSVTRQSEDTFQVRWIQTTYENGSREESTAFTANISLKLEKPRNRRDVFVNPLGLYITAIYVEQDFKAES